MIIDGEEIIKSGILLIPVNSKEHAIKYRSAILRAINRKYGATRVRAFQRDLNMILKRCLGLTLDRGEHHEMIRREHERAKVIMEQYGPALKDPAKAERAKKIINAQLNRVRQVGEETLNKNLDPENNFNLLLVTKGGSENIGQISGLLGPQYDGTELVASSGDSIYQSKHDMDPEGFGFIAGSFLRGMTPQEFFNHAKSGRVGLVDTSIKTAEPGTLTREMIKSLENVIIGRDGAVRLISNMLLQVYYGDTALNPEKLINVDFPEGTIPTFIDIESVAGRLNSQYYVSLLKKKKG